MADAATQLGLAPSTLHRWLADGFIAGEQITPGAPWRIRLTDHIRALFVDDAPKAGWPCSKPPTPTASPAKPLPNVSNAASSKPSTSAPDDEKACVSHPPHKTRYSDHDNERKEQCDHASKKSAISAIHFPPACICPPDPTHSRMRRLLRAKPETHLGEHRLEHRFQNLPRRLLTHPEAYSGRRY